MLDTINLTFFLNTLQRIFIDGFWNKIVLGTGVALMRVLFDFSLWNGVEALGILVVFHFILGVINAARRNGWASINLTKANATPVKVVVYGILISSAFLTEKALGGVELYLDQMVVGFLAVAEFREIIRHAAELGYVLPKVFMDKIKSLLPESNDSK